MLTTLKVPETLGLANALGFPLPFGKAQRTTKEGPQTAYRKQRRGDPAAQLNIHFPPPERTLYTTFKYVSVICLRRKIYMKF